MNVSKFTKATRKQSKCRLALIGPSGSGKTLSSLRIAHGLGVKIALVDSERNSASKYAGSDNPDGGKLEFDTLSLESFHPDQYISAIHAADAAAYDVLIIDSLSHAWSGKDGVLELVDKAAARSQSGNKFTAWREASPLHNHLIDAILGSRCHIIATMRSKTEYVMDEVERGGKTIKIPRKIGLAPIQRENMEYEFDVVADMDLDNNLLVSKTRCSALSKAVIKEPGKAFAEVLKTWLSDGEAVRPPLDILREKLVEASINEGVMLEKLVLWKKIGSDIPSLEFVPEAVIANVVGNWEQALAALRKPL